MYYSKQLTAFLLGTLLFFVGFYPAILLLHAEDAPKFETHRSGEVTEKSAPRDKDTGWLVAESTKGNFSVLVPIQFADTTVHTQTEEGKPLILNLIAAKSLEGFRFHAFQANAQEKDPEAWIKKQIATFTSNDSDALSTDRTPVGNFPAVAILMRNSVYEGFMRSVHMGEAIVFMSFEYPKSYANIARPYGIPFLSSLRLKTNGEYGKTYPVSLAIPGESATEAFPPPAGRVWTSKDYKQTAELITKGKLALPSLLDSANRDLFKRIISRENLAFATNKTLLIEARGQEILDIMESVGVIQTMYAAQYMRTRQMTKDFALIAAFLIHTCKSAWLTTSEYMATVPKDDKYAVRMEGLEKTKAGFSEILTGALLIALDDGNPADCRKIILNALNENISETKSLLTNEAARNFCLLLEGGMKNARSKDELALLNQILEKM